MKRARALEAAGRVRTGGTGERRREGCLSGWPAPASPAGFPSVGKSTLLNKMTGTFSEVQACGAGQAAALLWAARPAAGSAWAARGAAMAAAAAA